jgi:hypothetical protein
MWRRVFRMGGAVRQRVPGHRHGRIHLTMPRRCLWIFAIVVAALRLGLVLYVDPDLSLNNDEHRNYRIAHNAVAGLGYVHPEPNTGELRSSAFHSSFTVLLYEAMIRAGIPPWVWVLLVQCAAAVLFALSIPALHDLAARRLPKPWAMRAAVLYAVFPSVIYYIGALPFHENVVLPAMVIACERCARIVADRYRTVDVVVVSLALLATAVLRTQALVVFTLLLGMMVVMLLWQRRYLAPLLFAPAVLATALVHIPVLRKNHAQFGHWIISTQSGFELLQGHNPLARGSWMGNWYMADNPHYRYVHEAIPGLDAMDEYEESMARRRLALEWIREDPLAELRLAVRKVALWLFPHNYEVLPGHRLINPVNAFVYLFFVLGTGWLLLRRDLRSVDAQLMAPILGSLALTLVFFMGARWRYYAEPFMVVYAMYGLMCTVEWARRRGLLRPAGN